MLCLGIYLFIHSNGQAHLYKGIITIIKCLRLQCKISHFHKLRDKTLPSISSIRISEIALIRV